MNSKQVAKRGGHVAGNARKNAEKELGHGIVSYENYLDSPENQIKITSKIYKVNDIEK